MPSLLELPIELIELVASFLAPTDLFLLRSTCRDAAAATSDVFGRTCFADRTFLLACPHSMAIVENISSHAHLSNFLKKLRFSAAILRPHDRLQASRCFITDFVSRPRQEERRIRKEYAAAYKKLIQDQWNFSGQDQYDLLVRVFRNLEAAGSTPDVLCPGFGFDYDCPAGSRPTGFWRLEDISGYPFPLCYEHCSGPMIGYIYEAILETNFPVRHLELATDSPGVPMRRLLCPPAYDRFKDLHTLRLYVVPEEDEEQAFYAVANMLGILFNAVNLRQLTLGIYHQPFAREEVSYVALFATLANVNYDELKRRRLPDLLPNLTDLELVGHQIEYKDMYAFVSRRCTTLQRISMKRSQHDDWTHRDVHPTELMEQITAEMEST